MSKRRILIVGGSTRAAADSVRRAGWEPVCADLFADLDLRMTAEVIPVQNYPESLPDDVAHVRADGWFYCGALENSPRILEGILRKGNLIGPLLGVSPDALGKLRDPGWLATSLDGAGLKTLSVVNQSSPPQTDGTWLQKPLASAGGRMIRIWDETAARIPFPEAHYFQKIAPGTGGSVVFRIHLGNAEWLGSAYELKSPSESDPPLAFSYCGSFGPIPDLPVAVEAKLKTMIRTIIDHIPSIDGFVGLDFRFDGNDVWLLEVNPRYTASIEVLELGMGHSFLNPLVFAGRSDGEVINLSDTPFSLTSTEKTSSSSNLAQLTGHQIPCNSQMFAKQILYASESFVAPDLLEFVNTSDPWKIPLIADIPVPGTVVERGWPICTVMATGKNRQELELNRNERLSIAWDALRRLR